MAFHIFYAKKEKIYPFYISKHHSNCEKHVILLIISNGETPKTTIPKNLKNIKE